MKMESNAWVSEQKKWTTEGIKTRKRSSDAEIQITHLLMGPCASVAK